MRRLSFTTQDPTTVRKDSPLRNKSLEELDHLQTYWQFVLGKMQYDPFFTPDVRAVVKLQIKKIENLRYEMSYLLPPEPVKK